MKHLKATYDDEANAAYLYVHEGVVHRTIPFEPETGEKLHFEILVDLDAHDNLVGVEILYVNK
jgi:uncharacterized protein YuzE